MWTVNIYRLFCIHCLYNLWSDISSPIRIGESFISINNQFTERWTRWSLSFVNNGRILFHSWLTSQLIRLLNPCEFRNPSFLMMASLNQLANWSFCPTNRIKFTTSLNKDLQSRKEFIQSSNTLAIERANDERECHRYNYMSLIEKYMNTFTLSLNRKWTIHQLNEYFFNEQEWVSFSICINCLMCALMELVKMEASRGPA